MLDARPIKHLRLPMLVNLAPQALTCGPSLALSRALARSTFCLEGPFANLICIKIELAVFSYYGFLVVSPGGNLLRRSRW